MCKSVKGRRGERCNFEMVVRGGKKKGLTQTIKENTLFSGKNKHLQVWHVKKKNLKVALGEEKQKGE